MTGVAAAPSCDLGSILTVAKSHCSALRNRWPLFQDPGVCSGLRAVLAPVALPPDPGEQLPPPRPCPVWGHPRLPARAPQPQPVFPSEVVCFVICWGAAPAPAPRMALGWGAGLATASCVDCVLCMWALGSWAVSLAYTRPSQEHPVVTNHRCPSRGTQSQEGQGSSGPCAQATWAPQVSLALTAHTRQSWKEKGMTDQTGPPWGRWGRAGCPGEERRGPWKRRQ